MRRESTTASRIALIIHPEKLCRLMYIMSTNYLAKSFNNNYLKI